jgi:hypothetical protein
VGLEVILVLQPFPDQPVIVDLAIDRERNALVLVGKWLGSALDADNAQTLMGENCSYASEVSPLALASPLTCVVGVVGPRPVWPTMATLLGHLQGRRLECLCVWHMVTAHDTTHDGGGRGGFRTNWPGMSTGEREDEIPVNSDFVSVVIVERISRI